MHVFSNFRRIQVFINLDMCPLFSYDIFFKKKKKSYAFRNWDKFVKFGTGK